MPFKAGVNAKKIKQPSQARKQRGVVQDAADAVVDVVGVPTVGNLEEVPINLERLEPVGSLWGGQVSITPNEAISPTDCELWPDSPFCEGGSALSVGDFLDVDVSVYEGENEVVIVIDPSIAFINFPPFVAAWQKDGTQRPIKQDVAPSGPEIEYTPIHGLRDRCAYATFGSNGSWLLTVGGVTGTSTERGFETRYYWHCIEFWTFPSSARQLIGFRSTKRSVGEGRKIVYEGKIGEIDFFQVQRLVGWTDSERDSISRTINRSGGIRWNQIYCGNELTRGNVPLLEPAPVSNCCKQTAKSFKQQQQDLEELKKQVKEIWEAVGANGEWPSTVPKSLHGSDSGSAKLNNIPQFQGYIIEQLDALIGEFPVKIKQEGDGDGGDVEMVSIADGLADIYGLMATAAYDSDMAINLLYRISSELIATKNATLITQDWVKGNAEFLGYNGNEKKRRINSSFSPKHAADGHEKFLNESTYDIIGWENQEKESIKEVLVKLMFAAQLIKARYLMKDVGGLVSAFNFSGIEESSKLGDLIQELNKADKNTKAKEGKRSGGNS